MRRHGVYRDGDAWIVYIKNRSIAYGDSEVEAQHIFDQELIAPGSIVSWRKPKPKIKPVPVPVPESDVKPEIRKPTLSDYSLINNNNKRARRMNAIGRITAHEWIEVCAKFGNYCISCGVAWKLTIDHVVPLIRGGTNTIDNIQPLCQSCNSSKHTKIIDYRLCPAQRIYRNREREP